jgi:hypothetical protein
MGKIENYHNGIMFFPKIVKNDFILPIIDHIFCIFGTYFLDLLPFYYDILPGSNQKPKIVKMYGNGFFRKKYNIFFIVA